MYVYIYFIQYGFCISKYTVNMPGKHLQSHSKCVFMPSDMRDEWASYNGREIFEQRVWAQLWQGDKFFALED